MCVCVRVCVHFVSIISYATEYISSQPNCVLPRNDFGRTAKINKFEIVMVQFLHFYLGIRTLVE